MVINDEVVTCYNVISKGLEVVQRFMAKLARSL